MKSSLIRKALFLFLTLLVIPVTAYSASGVAQVFITDLDSSKFPLINLYVRITDITGIPVSGLKSEEITIQEGNHPINDFQLKEIDLGTYVSIVIDAGAGIDADGATFQSRLAEIKEVVGNYVQSMNENDYAEVIMIQPLDQITVVQDFTNVKSLITESVNALNVESDQFLTFGLQGLNRAIDDLVGVGSQTGYKAILFLSSGIQDQGRQNLTLHEFDTKATQLAIPVHSVLFNQTFLDSNYLDLISRETGGEFVHYTRALVETPIFDKIFSQGTQYQVSYRSSSPDATRVITVTALPSVEGNVFDDIRMELNPSPASPEIISVTVNNNDPLVRKPDDRAGEDTFWPLEVEVVFGPEWPDGYGDRKIDWAELVVDGEIVGDRITDIAIGDPIQFKWDLRTFNHAGETSHNVQIHFQDELGYEVISPDHNVALTVETAVCGQYQGNSRITCLLGSVVAPILGGVSFLLIIAGVAYYYFRRDDFMARMGAVQTTASKLYEDVTDRIRGRQSGGGQQAVGHLIVQRGIANMRKKYPLYQRVTTIGKDRSKIKEEDGDILISDGAVSGSHANIGILGDEYNLTDMGSSNGTWLNGIELEAEETQTLNDGDVIELVESEPGERLIVLEFTLGGRTEKEDKDQDKTTRTRK